MWQTHFGQFLHPKTGKPLPSFARKYLLTTTPDSNDLGRWFAIRFVDKGWVSPAEYEAARALREVVARGAYRVEVSGATTAVEAA
jgi:hypothetical protein